MFKNFSFQAIMILLIKPENSVDTVNGQLHRMPDFINTAYFNMGYRVGFFHTLLPARSGKIDCMRPLTIKVMKLVFILK